jgi:hypothetical protein
MYSRSSTGSAVPEVQLLSAEPTNLDRMFQRKLNERKNSRSQLRTEPASHPRMCRAS